MIQNNLSIQNIFYINKIIIINNNFINYQNNNFVTNITNIYNF